MPTSARSDRRFWSRLFVYRILWLLVAGLPTCHLAYALWPAIHFGLTAHPEVGRVVAHGLEMEEVVLTGRDTGSWVELNPAPWIDVEFDDREGRPGRCRISGQLGVLEGWVSDNRDEVAQALQARLNGWRDGIDFHRTDHPQRCAVGKDFGLGRLVIFMPFLALTIGFAVATVTALRERSSEGKQA